MLVAVDDCAAEYLPGVWVATDSLHFLFSLAFFSNSSVDGSVFCLIV